MGLFSRKKTITVSSTLYNLAGPVDQRPNFLKSSVFGAIIADDGSYLGETLTNNYLTGPGIKQRQFYNWAVRTSYEGLPVSSIASQQKLDLETVKAEIPVPATPAGLVTQMQSAILQDGDFSWVAEKHILDNFPALYNTDWVADYDAEDHEVVIQYEDTSVEYVPAGDYDPAAQYIIAYFYQSLPTEAGPWTEIDSGMDIIDFSLVPSTGSYTFDNLDTVGTPLQTFVDLEEKTTEDRTYSDATPPTSTSSSTFTTETFQNEDTTYLKHEYNGSNGDTVETTESDFIFTIREKRAIRVDTVVTTTTNDMGGGVTETVTTTVETEVLEPAYDYSIEEQITTTSKVVGGYQMFVYKIGGTNANLNGLVTTAPAALPEFFPFIPIRLSNKSIKDEIFDSVTGNGLYASSKTAYRKAFGKNKFNSTIDSLEDNPDLGDIDYAYLFFGVPLNVAENSSKKYLFNFFEGLVPFQNTTGSSITNLQANIDAYDIAIAAYENWVTAQGDNTDPLFNTPRPDVPTIDIPEYTTIRINTDHVSLDDFDNRISWFNIDVEVIAGLYEAGANGGNVKIEKGGTLEWQSNNGFSSEKISLETIVMYYQTSDTSHKKMTIYGLQHKNLIYKGKSVNISGHDALDDSEESGFLIPLHNPTVRNMGLVDATQMTTANAYMVINTYEVTKQKWYETLGFKILVVILIVAVTVATAGAGTVGILGANAAVGASLGLSGTAAVIAGAVANAVAALVLTQVITYASKQLLGDRIGAIVGTVLSIAVTGGLSGANFGDLMTVTNVLAVTNVTLNAFNDYNAEKWNDKLTDLEEKYEGQMDTINQKMEELGLNNGNLSFSPMQLIDESRGQGLGGATTFVPESADDFIHRTTMVGSDIAEVTLSMVQNYVNLTLQLPYK